MKKLIFLFLLCLTFSCSNEDFEQKDSMDLTLTNDNIYRTSVPKVRLDTGEPTTDCNVKIVIMGEGFTSSQQQEFIDIATNMYNRFTSRQATTDGIFDRWKNRVDWYYSVLPSTDQGCSVLADDSGYDPDGQNPSAVSKNTWLSVYQNRSNLRNNLGMSDGARTTLDTKLKNTFPNTNGKIFAIIVVNERLGGSVSPSSSDFGYEYWEDYANQHGKTQSDYGTNNGDYKSVVCYTGVPSGTQDPSTTNSKKLLDSHAGHYLGAMFGLDIEYNKNTSSAIFENMCINREPDVIDFAQPRNNVIHTVNQSYYNVPSGWESGGLGQAPSDQPNLRVEGINNSFMQFFPYMDAGDVGNREYTDWQNYLLQKYMRWETGSDANNVSPCYSTEPTSYTNPYPNI